MKRLILVCVLGCFLGGCGAPSTYYNRGFSEEQTDREYLDCQMKAGAAAGNDDFRRLLFTTRCMQSKGY